jgi:site-specific DNA recombinase
MTTAAIYARVSSARQREEQTIASQTAALLEHAVAQGLEVPAAWIFEDEGYSGATLVRPGLERLRDLAAQVGVDILLCYSPDRLARKYSYQALLVEEFARVGTEVRFLKGPRSDSPEDALLVQFQGMIAEYERAQIGERTRRGKLHRARAGVVNVLSGAPYGYRYVRRSEHAEARYEVTEPEATIVQEIYGRYVEDQLSIADLTRWLTAQGVPTVTGKNRWDRSTVWGILRNPAYVGRAGFAKTAVSDRRPAVTRRVRLQGRKLSRHPAHRDRPREEWIEIPVPAIVSEEIFAAAARRLDDNKRFAARNSKVPSLLQGLVSCQRCGYACYRTSTRTSARKLSYYRCLGSDGWRYEHGPVCSVRPIRQDELDALVWAHVTSLLADPALIRNELDRRLCELRQSDPTKAQRGRLELELSRVSSAASRLLAAYQEDLISLDELRVRMPDLRKRESSLKAQLDALEAQQLDHESYLALAENLESFLIRLREGAEAASIEDRQRILRLLVRDVLLGPDQVVIRHSIPISTMPDPPSGYRLRRRSPLAAAGQHCSVRSGRTLLNSLGGARPGMATPEASSPRRRCGASRSLCGRFRGHGGRTTRGRRGAQGRSRRGARSDGPQPVGREDRGPPHR